LTYFILQLDLQTTFNHHNITHTQNGHTVGNHHKIIKDSACKGTTNNPHNNEADNTIQISTHTPVQTRNSLPDVEIDQSSQVSLIPDHNQSLLIAADKYNVSKSLDDVSRVGSNDLLVANPNVLRRPSDWDLLSLKNSSLVSYETREGNAKYEKDFIPCSGTLVSCFYNNLFLYSRS